MITEEKIREHIVKIGFSKLGEKTTVCLITLDCWFEVVWTSSCIDKEEYNQEIWNQMAEKKAIDKCWELFWFMAHYESECEGVKEVGTWLFKEKWRITLRYGGKEITIADKNCWWDDKLFTRDEAVKHCKRLKSMHLPTIEEWSELLKLWCEWKGYKYRTSNEWLVYVRDIDNDDKKIWKEFAEDFNLPFAGYRNYSNANISDQGSYGYYWSSSPESADSNFARYLYLSSSYATANNTGNRAYGFSVRCFKNSYGS